MRAVLALLSAQAATAISSEAGANPIRRIVNLLQDMKKEIELDGEKEEALFKSFMCYCKNNDGQLSADAKAAAETIDTNNAAATEKTGQKKQIQEELTQHKADRKEAQETLAKEFAQRKKDKADYDKSAGETGSYIAATTNALKALRRGTVKAKQPLSAEDRADAFLQSPEASVLKNLVAVAKMESYDQQTLMSFLQGDYHTVGNEIIGILDNMLEEFKKSLGALQEQEEQAVKLFLELKAAKESEIASATKAIESKSETKGRLAVEIVQHKNAADTATKELGDAQAFLVNLKQSCADKQADWDARSKERADELAAIQEAVDVLNDDDALDIFKATESTGPGAALSQQKMSFLQKSSSANVAVRAQKLLKSVKGSPALNLLAAAAASKLKSATSVDFSKIIIMIDDMIKLLKEEQAHDENVQNQCNDNLRTNAGDRKNSNAEIKSLQSKIEALEAAIKESQENVEKKNVEIAELDKSVQEATEQRKAENTEFNELVSLNTSAIQLVEKAKNKLNKFYNPGQYKAPEERELSEEERLLKGAGQDIGDTTAQQNIAGTSQSMGSQLSFLQLAADVKAPSLPPPPESYGEHKHKGKKSNSVIALLNHMQNGLKSELQAAEHDEKTSQENYEKNLAAAAQQKADAQKTIADTQAAIAEAEDGRNQSSENLTSEETRLAALKDDEKRLHEECDFVLAHFEERREARNTEVEGLTTAKSILSGADFQ